MEKQSHVFALELMQLKEEHARWLAMAIEHAKECPDNSLFQEYLKEVEERMASASAQPSLATTLNWADFQSHDIPELGSSSVSATTSSPRDDAFDPSEFYNDAPMLENTTSLKDEKSMSPSDLQSRDTAMSYHASAHSRSTSCSDMTSRKHSISSSSNSGKGNSSSASCQTTPEADNSKEDSSMSVGPVMMPNPRIAKFAEVAGLVAQKRMRSGNTIPTGKPAESH
jgi:hypothetical protein